MAKKKKKLSKRKKLNNKIRKRKALIKDPPKVDQNTSSSEINYLPVSSISPFGRPGFIDCRSYGEEIKEIKETKEVNESDLIFIAYDKTFNPEISIAEIFQQLKRLNELRLEMSAQKKRYSQIDKKAKNLIQALNPGNSNNLLNLIQADCNPGDSNSFLNKIMEIQNLANKLKRGQNLITTSMGDINTLEKKLDENRPIIQEYINFQQKQATKFYQENLFDKEHKAIRNFFTINKKTNPREFEPAFSYGKALQALKNLNGKTKSQDLFRHIVAALQPDKKQLYRRADLDLMVPKFNTGNQTSFFDGDNSYFMQNFLKDKKDIKNFESIDTLLESMIKQPRNKIQNLVFQHPANLRNARRNAFIVLQKKHSFSKVQEETFEKYYQIIPSDKIEARMDCFFKKLDDKLEKLDKRGKTPTKDNIVSLAAWVHLKIIDIHPLNDGNGRTARLFMNFLLKRFNMPKAHILNNEDYMNAVKNTIKKKDNTIFKDYIYKVIYNSNNYNIIKDINSFLPSFKSVRRTKEEHTALQKKIHQTIARQRIT